MTEERTQIRRIEDLLSVGEDEQKPKRTAVLIMLAGSEIGRMFRLNDGDTIIGRSRNAGLTLSDEGISREHVHIQLRGDGGVNISDLGSTNGTLVNGRRLFPDETQRLMDGDKIQVGATVMLKFSYQDAMEEQFQQRLYASAVRDPLTGIYNKGYLLERVAQEWAYSIRHSMPLSMAVVDLDLFKRVNDTLGHAAGDEVLKQVAQCLARQLRVEEVVARYGGEEFVVLLRETPLDHAVTCAERLRVAIECLPIFWNGSRVPVTASIGVASTEQTKGSRWQDLFEQADQRLYAAKRGGRNRVVG